MQSCTPTSKEEKEEEALYHQMTNEIQLLSRKLVLLMERLQSKDARDFLAYGVMRRLSIIRLNLKTIFQIAYCGRREMLGMEEEANHLDMHIHSFFYHCYGALDNAAWCIAHEKEFPLRNNKFKVSLFGKEFSSFVKKSHASLHQVLRAQEKLYRRIKGIRDAIAHRKPLYVPPGVINEKETIFEPVFCVEGDPIAFFPIKESSLMTAEYLLAIINALRRELETGINEYPSRL